MYQQPSAVVDSRLAHHIVHIVILDLTHFPMSVTKRGAYTRKGKGVGMCEAWIVVVELYHEAILSAYTQLPGLQLALITSQIFSALLLVLEAGCELGFGRERKVDVDRVVMSRDAELRGASARRAFSCQERPHIPADTATITVLPNRQNDVRVESRWPYVSQLLLLPPLDGCTILRKSGRTIGKRTGAERDKS